MKSSPKRTVAAPELCASARAARARSRFPAMSPTTGLSWASAIFMAADMARCLAPYDGLQKGRRTLARSEEHTSELQSLTNLVCRLLLEKKNTGHKLQIL